MESETIKDLLKSGVNVNVTIGINELREFFKEVIIQTKKELEEVVDETYLSTKEVSELLKIDATTLWRWNKSGHLKSVGFSGRKRYKLSDVKMFLEKDH